MASVGTVLTAGLDNGGIIGPLGNRVSCFPKAGETIYAGGLFYINASGLGVKVPVSDGSTDLSAKRVLQNYGPDIVSAVGTETLVGMYGQIAILDNYTADSGATYDCSVNDVLQIAYATSDHEIVNQEANSSGKNPKVGMIVDLSSDLSKVYVHVLPQSFI